MSNQKTKHTPGPWKVEKHGSESPQIWNQNTKIAEMITDHPYHGDDAFPDTEANARLIAACPELLAALEHVRNGYGHKLSSGCLQIIESAIAKATGGDL